jgi:hypothetical protein
MEILSQLFLKEKRITMYRTNSFNMHLTEISYEENGVMGEQHLKSRYSENF